MDDDFNTPEALAVLFNLAREINRSQDTSLKKAQGLAALLVKLGGILGLLQKDPQTFSTQGCDVKASWVQEMIEKRQKAKEAKDFSTADAIRETLIQKGILLEDTPNGTTWRVKRDS